MPSENMQKYWKFIAATWGSDTQTNPADKHLGIYYAQDAAIEPTFATVVVAARAITKKQHDAAVAAVTGVAPNNKDNAAPDPGDVHSSAVRVCAANPFTSAEIPDDDARHLADASNKWTLALKEYDIDVPRNRVIYVHRNTRDEYHYVVPESPATNPANLEDQVELAMTYVMTDS